MSTIDFPSIIVTLLEHRGKYPGDPPMERVYSYINQGGLKVYAIFEHKRLDDMAGNPLLSNPILLQEDGELTEAGRVELARLKEEGYRSYNPLE